jgi:exopolyphosphatase/guanosine-5'-triphosphate,3'-diphosphate pyrophosphatase
VSSFPERLAAIDVGSNTILLLIAEYDPASGLSIIDEAEDQPRLGAGLGDHVTPSVFASEPSNPAAVTSLKPESIERALRSLERMRELCQHYGVTRIGAVATAAVRDAANGEEFVQQAQRLGITLRTISPETEAELAFRSAAYHFPGGGRMLVADIGGGSLELIGAVEHRLELITSLPLGAVRLTERRQPLPRLRREIGEQLRGALAPDAWTGARVIGSGGTFANLAGMTLARRGEFSNAAIQGVEITSQQIEAFLAELAAMDLDRRRQVPGLRPERADIIVAGVAAVAELLNVVGAKTVSVNRYGIREGLLLEMLE